MSLMWLFVDGADPTPVYKSTPTFPVHWDAPYHPDLSHPAAGKQLLLSLQLHGQQLDYHFDWSELRPGLGPTNDGRFTFYVSRVRDWRNLFLTWRIQIDHIVQHKAIFVKLD